jgi:hypothetical protein
MIDRAFSLIEMLNVYVVIDYVREHSNHLSRTFCLLAQLLKPLNNAVVVVKR